MSWNTGAELTYFNWRHDQPTNDHIDDNCIVFDAENGLWSDVLCSRVTNACPVLCQSKSMKRFFFSIYIECIF